MRASVVDIRACHAWQKSFRSKTIKVTIKKKRLATKEKKSFPSQLCNGTKVRWTVGVGPIYASFQLCSKSRDIVERERLQKLNVWLWRQK